MMGVPLGKVVVRLGDSAFPVSAGSGGQWGSNSSTSGVYAACVQLREAVARPELSQRDRSLVTVGALIAMNRPDQLRSHRATMASHRPS